METNAVVRRVCAMWKALGEEFEARARALAKSDRIIDRERALDDAAAAEGCYWRATGESDAIDLKERKP